MALKTEVINENVVHFENATSFVKVAFRSGKSLHIRTGGFPTLREGQAIKLAHWILNHFTRPFRPAFPETDPARILKGWKATQKRRKV